MKAQIHFSDKGAKLVYLNGELVQVLVTSDLDEEYTLYQEPTKLEPKIEDWLQKFPWAWAEIGSMGLALHCPLVYVEIKAGVDPIKVRQYSNATGI